MRSPERSAGPLGKILAILVALPVAVTVILGVTGYLLFTRAADDTPGRADAIVVLGGEHDGREEYGMQLARNGVADTVVFSDPYSDRDRTMQKYCAAGTDAITVLCVPPEPATTRGEAIFTQELAQQYGWTHVVVVSWRYHLPRAKFIFGQCFDGTVSMSAVPRKYPFSLAQWEFTYLYQYAGFVKAALQGTPCGASD